MTGVEFLAVVLAGIVYGWLWCDPSTHFLDPLKWLVNRALTKPMGDEPPDPAPGPLGFVPPMWWRLQQAFGVTREPRRGRVATWVRHGRNCPPCMGFQANLAVAFVLAGVSWSSAAFALAAVAGHVAWMKLLDLGDRLVEALNQEVS